MVGNITSLTGHGLRDWLIQRVTAVIIGLYAVVLAAFWIMYPNIPYEVWHSFFACTWMKVLNSVAWLSVILHAWIGLWTITTDYIKSLGARLTLQLLIVIGLLGLFFWSLLVFWGV